MVKDGVCVLAATGFNIYIIMAAALVLLLAGGVVLRKLGGKKLFAVMALV